jgi:Family of unknown function (DUF5519)
MFNITVKYFGFLKHIPLLPHLFDSFMKIGILFSNKHILDYIDDIENEVLSWNNTTVHLHKFGGIQFDVNKKEIGHIHSNGILDILFTREIKEQLIKQGKAKEHHTFKNSGWITLYIKTAEDKNTAIELLRDSYLRKFT